MSKLFSHKASHKNQKGFTLIELLVVIAIIGILSSVVLASLNSARTKARDAKRVADVKQIQIALELYFDASSKYPFSLASLVCSGGCSGGASLSVLPKDPNATDYHYAVNSITVPTAYHLGATLEQTSAQTTLTASDKDFSSTATWAAITQTSPSALFDGTTDVAGPNVYDVSNQ
ncbi:MAG: prepilin-type N-terminal cleavage/methylation domain-containing protein [bacterium]|nr:prepilin-type N-terminal cleavage/methylation domain-containing protein [bacterium]